MPTEEELQRPPPSAPDAKASEELAVTALRIEDEESKTNSESLVDDEQKSKALKAEQQQTGGGEDSAQSPTTTETLENPAKEESKLNENRTTESSSSTSEEEFKKESTEQSTKVASSPQHEAPDVSSEGNAFVVDKAPTTPVTVASVPTGQEVEEEDEDEEDDEEETGENEEQEDHTQEQQQHQQQKQRRDGYSTEEAPHHHQQNQSQTPTGGQYYEDDEEDEEDEGEEPSELRQLFEPINDSQALSEDEEDGDYIPDEEVKKTIMVGSDFQAVIPEGLCRYDDALPYENEDKLLWNPTILNEQEIEEYLVKITGTPGVVGTGATGAQQKGGTTGAIGTGAVDPQSNSVYAIPLGNHLRDDEQSLYLLQQCGHNIDEALRRRRISNNSVPVPEQQMSIWSEEECRNFENGLRVHGKDFHMIQQTKVRTRSVGELVQFYYLWKKTERHDLFASKARLEKKKYNLHPGLTDHMDRFLEEQENSTGFGDRSSSPGFNSLYNSASEAKRQRLLDSKENNTASSKRSASNL